MVTHTGETLHTYAFQLTQDLSKVTWVLPRVDPEWHDRMITRCRQEQLAPIAFPAELHSDQFGTKTESILLAVSFI